MIHLFTGTNALRLYREMFTDCSHILFEFPVVRIVYLKNNIDLWVNINNAIAPANQYWQVYEGSFQIKTPATLPHQMDLADVREGEYQLMLYKFASYQGNPNLVAAPDWTLITPAVVTSAFFRTKPAPIQYHSGLNNS